jgi:acetylornithine/LysW-gamma-L-lysine aminotransferase
MDTLKKGEQTSTFGGNPLSCAAGTATLDYIIKNDLPAQAVSKGAFFLDQLRSLGLRHRTTREARGLGLMLALEMRVDIQNIILSSIKEHVLYTYSGRTILRLLPPLVITEAQIKRVIESLDTVLTMEEKSPG